MGFRFGTSGSYNYGYLEVTWDPTSQDFQILSAAYESTVNTAITTPGGASVPTPSPASLVALVVGGALLRRWREERRQQRLQETSAA
jgi:MYXO-CTERM domain-containing protein